MATDDCWHCVKRSSTLEDDSPLSVDNNGPENGSLSIIVLGASGDLAKKKTFPALFNLYKQVR
jgi:glucose-6-phosphate 1-dehydrogenase